MSDGDPFESDETQPEGGGIDVMELCVRPLWAARYWLVLAACVGATAGAVQSLLKPNEFTSLGKFLVRPGTRESTTPEGRIIGDGSGAPLGLRESIQNQIHLLQNPEVTRRAVAELGARTILEPYDPTEHDNEQTPLHMRWAHQLQREWFRRADTCLSDPGRGIDGCPRCVEVAEDVIAKGIVVFPELGSSVLSVVYTAHSPQVAAKVVDAFMRAALSHHQRVFDIDSTLQFLDGRLLDARVKADLADQALTRYRTDCGLFDYEEQRASHLAQIDTLESELARNEARLAELRSQQEFYRAALEKEPAELSSQTPQAPMSNPDYEWLTAEVLKTRLELAALDPAAYTTQAQLDARRRQLQEQLSQANSALETTPRLIAMDPLVSSLRNPRYDTLLQRQREVDAERIGLIQGQSQRRDRIAELRRQLEHFEECRPNLAAKEREANQAEDEYKHFKARREQAALMNQLDSTQLTNLAVLQAANVPRAKSGPKRGRTVAIAGFLGAALAVSVALLRSVLAMRSKRADEALASGDLRAIGDPVSHRRAQFGTRG